MNNLYKKHDIFITASKKDPCSNALIEALHCGLPAIALNDGGHPEIVKNGGELFNNTNDVLFKIDKISNNYHFYQKNIYLPSIKEVGKQYYSFIKKVYSLFNTDANKKSKLNKINYFSYLMINFFFIIWRISEKYKFILNKNNLIKK